MCLVEIAAQTVHDESSRADSRLTFEMLHRLVEPERVRPMHLLVCEQIQTECIAS